MKLARQVTLSENVAHVKIGVLIIGSLWWRDGGREKWRASRLAVGHAVTVKVPIHYGRRSSNQTYTMTFAQSGLPGVALIVPCQVAGDHYALRKEAEELWGAEINGAAEPNKIGKQWGSVGALFRPATPPEEIARWSAYFAACGGKSLAAVDDAGLLSLTWPERVDGQALDCDVLLATSNVETAPALPEEIAAAWIEHGHEEYFFENVRSGIRTSEDEKIWRHMVGALDWIKRQTARYGPTIEALRNQYPTKTAPTVRFFAPEVWGAVDRFRHFYRSTYSFPPYAHARVVGTAGHFERAALLRQLAHSMIPSMALDRAELEAKGFTHAEQARILTAVIESSITSLYSALDCGRYVVTHVFAKKRGLPDSTRGTFQRAADGKLDPTLPPAILKAFADAPWFSKFCKLRDALTHGETGSCSRDHETGKIMYFHDAIRTSDEKYVPDIFAVLDENFDHVNKFLGLIFSALLATLKDDEVEQMCGVFGGLLYLRKVRLSEAKDVHSGRCESHVWFDQPGKERCPLAATCIAYDRRHVLP